MFPSTSSKYSSLYGPSASVASSAAETGIWMAIAAILAIIGGILVHFLFVKAKTEPKNKFLVWLKEFLAFKTMWIETIVKIFYYIGTIYVILFSFALISTSFLSFILTLVLGPVIIRIIYEAFIMYVMIWRNTADLAKSAKK